MAKHVSGERCFKRRCKAIKRMLRERVEPHIRVTDGLVYKTAMNTLYKQLKRSEEEQDNGNKE